MTEIRKVMCPILPRVNVRGQPTQGSGRRVHSRLPLGSIIPMSADFDLDRLPEEHQAIREAVREVCTDKVAPHAADVDETAQFPQASYDALRAADFHAPHIPESYG